MRPRRLFPRFWLVCSHPQVGRFEDQYGGHFIVCRDCREEGLDPEWIYREAMEYEARKDRDRLRPIVRDLLAELKEAE